MGREVTLVLKGEVSTNVPASASNGEVSEIWIDGLKRVVPAGYDYNTNSERVSNINSVVLESLGPITSLDAVTATGSGTQVGVGDYSWHSYQVIGTGFSETGSLFYVEVSMDNTNWQTLFSQSINTNNNSDGILYSSEWNFEYSRCGLDLDTNGSFSGSYTVLERHRV